MAKSKKLSKELSDIAEYFIYLSNKDDKYMTNLKLQKLVYYAQAWNLVFNHKRLFKDPIEAWIHGPVVYALWKKYNKFKFGRIEVNVVNNFNFSEKTKEILDEVWDVYGGFDARYLEELTHYERPWQDARGKLDCKEVSDARITAVSMKEYYRNRYNTAKIERQNLNR